MGVCTGGGGAGICGGGSKLEMEDILIGFGGGDLTDLCSFSAGGCGGANLGWSGTTFKGGLHLGMEDDEPVEQMDGGLGGDMGGGLRRVKSSSSPVDASRGVRLARAGPFISPRKSGGGRIKVPGGGGAAMAGGGGINMSPTTGSGTDIRDPLDKLSPLTVKRKKEKKKR